MAKVSSFKAYRVPLFGYIGSDLVVARSPEEAVELSKHGCGDFLESDEYPNSNDAIPPDVDDVVEYDWEVLDRQNLASFLRMQRTRQQQRKKADLEFAEMLERLQSNKEKINEV